MRKLLILIPFVLLKQLAIAQTDTEQYNKKYSLFNLSQKKK